MGLFAPTLCSRGSGNRLKHWFKSLTLCGFPQLWLPYLASESWWSLSFFASFLTIFSSSFHCGHLFSDCVEVSLPTFHFCLVPWASFQEGGLQVTGSPGSVMEFFGGEDRVQVKSSVLRDTVRKATSLLTLWIKQKGPVSILAPLPPHTVLSLPWRVVAELQVCKMVEAGWAGCLTCWAGGEQSSISHRADPMSHFLQTCKVQKNAEVKITLDSDEGSEVFCLYAHSYLHPTTGSWGVSKKGSTFPALTENVSIYL